MGKVHGSLARAGKVKAATPKVSSLRFPTNATRYTTAVAIRPTSLLTTILHPGRAPGEEEEPQGSRLQACPLHPPLRQCYHDRWQAQGTYRMTHTHTQRTMHNDANFAKYPRPHHEYRK